MNNMVCTYCKDEFCVNAECPMRADYCPVPDTPGVCRYEERVEEKIEVEQHRLSPYECFEKAVNESGYGALGENTKRLIYDVFCDILREENWEITECPVECKENYHIEGEEWLPGQTATLDQIEKSPDWRVKSISPDPFDTSCSYVSKDDKFIIRFEDNATSGVVEPHYHVGEAIHVGALGASPYWKYIGEENDKARYETVDRSMFVAVPRESVWGTIMLIR